METSLAEIEDLSGWDHKVPLTNCFGFKASAGNLKILLGYATFDGGQVLLYCYEQIGGQTPQLWRRFWTSKEAAVDAAEDLCADIDDYLDSVCNLRRPYEDLDMDDFIRHIHTRLNNELN